MATWIKESERKRQLIEMLLKQAGYKLEGKMYVNNGIKSAFGVLEIFPEEPPPPVSEDVKAPSNIVEQLERDNPYPESVFIEPTSAEYKAVSRMFKKHGYSQDAFMGAFGRKVHTNAVSKLRELIKQQPPQGNAEDQDDDDELEDKIVNIMCESIEQDSDYSLRGTEEAARKIIKLFKNK